MSDDEKKAPENAPVPRTKKGYFIKGHAPKSPGRPTVSQQTYRAKNVFENILFKGLTRRGVTRGQEILNWLLTRDDPRIVMETYFRMLEYFAPKAAQTVKVQDETAALEGAFMAIFRERENRRRAELGMEPLPALVQTAAGNGDRGEDAPIDVEFQAILEARGNGEPTEESVPPGTSEPKNRSVPSPMSEPDPTSVPAKTSEPFAASGPNETSEPIHTSAPETASEPMDLRAPVIQSEPTVTSVPGNVSEPNSESAPNETSEPSPDSVPMTESEPPSEREPFIESEPQKPMDLREPVIQSEPNSVSAPCSESEPLPASVPVGPSEPMTESEPLLGSEPFLPTGSLNESEPSSASVPDEQSEAASADGTVHRERAEPSHQSDTQEVPDEKDPDPP